jgi:hypothetical protein
MEIEMSLDKKTYSQPDDGEFLDKAFDSEGVLYSGSLPLVSEEMPPECGSEEKQKPLTEKEQVIREYWQAKRDPVCWLLFNIK